MEFESIIEPPKIPEGTPRDNFIQTSKEIQTSLHYLNFINFLTAKLDRETKSFIYTDELNIPPIEAIATLKIEPFVDESYLFTFTIAESKTPYILSNYFDKVVIVIGTQQKEWCRDPETLELDSLEFIIANPEFPIKVSVTAYPDPPLQYFLIPDHLREITSCSVDFFAHIIKSITLYANQKGLINEEQLVCDELLQAVFGSATIPHSDIPLTIQSILLPLPPIMIDCFLDRTKTMLSYKIKLPDVSPINSVLDEKIPEEILSKIPELNEKKETIDFLCALERNPIETIEAEIAGHVSKYEMQDEKSTVAPNAILDQMNPALRSSVFFWQSWVSEHVQKYLEENQEIIARYPPRDSKKDK